MTKSYGSHHYINVNGVRFHYVRAGQGERLIVLLHGFPEFWYSWRGLLGPLGERFTVVAPDMRGYNLTDKPSWGYSVDVLAQDVVGLIDALGFQRAVVAGHDWGGAVAWATAILAPHRVERLIVLNCPHPLIMADALRSNPRQMLRSWYIGFFQIPLLPELLLRLNTRALLERSLRGAAINKAAFSDADLDAYAEALRQPGAASAALAYYRTMARGGFAALGQGHVIPPTLLIWGEDDFALGKELTYETGRYAPDLRIRYIPSCGHWVQQEQPQLVAAHMLDFLGGAG